MALDEAVDLVDRKDRVVGSSTLGECLAKGLLHRAVAVVVSRPDGRVILQQRSKLDRWQPGMWTLSCTGHVKKGEAYHDAASRELNEEIGIRADLVLVGKFLIPPLRENGMTEHEWVSLFAAASSARLKVDPVELEEVREFSPTALERELVGGSLTPDSIILLKEYLRGRGRARPPRFNMRARALDAP